jgi:hypothetical protein
MDEMAAVAREALSMPRSNAKEEDRVFRAFFGVPINVITALWSLLQVRIDDSHRNAERKHILWALVFLKIYSTEDVHRRIVGWPTAKTFRKWSWYFIGLVASLVDDVIRLDNRLIRADPRVNCLMSVDGTDCPVHEPWPFDSKWYSQKLNGPGVKYEVGVSIFGAGIVWINGPFVASKNDITVFQGSLRSLLLEDEYVEADSGYRGDSKLMTPQVSLSSNQRKQKSKVRARHENVNARLKVFNVLNISFRHMNPSVEMMEKHGSCFKAVVVLTQLKFQAGEKLCDVHYDAIYY